MFSHIINIMKKKIVYLLQCSKLYYNMPSATMLQVLTGDRAISVTDSRLHRSEFLATSSLNFAFPFCYNPFTGTFYRFISHHNIFQICFVAAILP